MIQLPCSYETTVLYACMCSAAMQLQLPYDTSLRTAVFILPPAALRVRFKRLRRIGHNHKSPAGLLRLPPFLFVLA
jgi:hypothetical protein